MGWNSWIIDFHVFQARKMGDKVGYKIKIDLQECG